MQQQEKPGLSVLCDELTISLNRVDTHKGVIPGNFWNTITHALHKRKMINRLVATDKNIG